MKICNSRKDGEIASNASTEQQPTLMSWFHPSRQQSTMQLLTPTHSQWGGEEERKKSKTHGLR